MKMFSKLLCSFWVVTLLVMLSLALPVNASDRSISPMVCGEHIDVSIAYDGASSSTFDYDLPSAHTANGKANQTRTDTALGHIAEFLAAESTATFGRAASTDYRATFFAANPELEGQVVVHHAVEQQTLKLYPSQVTEAEIHSLENLRGIPKDIISQVHLSQIRKEWNQFYLADPNTTQAQLLQKATEIDAKFGSQFRPPVGGGQ